MTHVSRAISFVHEDRGTSLRDRQNCEHDLCQRAASQRHQRTELRISKRDVHELHTAELFLTKYNHSTTRKIPLLLRSSTIAGSKSQHSYFFNIHLNIITPSMLRSYKQSLLFTFPRLNVTYIIRRTQFLPLDFITRITSGNE